MKKKLVDFSWNRIVKSRMINFTSVKYYWWLHDAIQDKLTSFGTELLIKCRVLKYALVKFTGVFMMEFKPIIVRYICLTRNTLNYCNIQFYNLSSSTDNLSIDIWYLYILIMPISIYFLNKRLHYQLIVLKPSAIYLEKQKAKTHLMLIFPLSFQLFWFTFVEACKIKNRGILSIYVDHNNRSSINASF